MPIKKNERLLIFERAGGRCECTSGHCLHHQPGERCTQELGEGWDVYYLRGDNSRDADTLIAVCAICYQNMIGGWEKHHAEMIQRMKTIRESIVRDSEPRSS
jgi:hypothetical protein